MAHSHNNDDSQLNLLTDDTLTTAIKEELGGKEIFGEEKIQIEKEIQRQDSVKEKTKVYLSWYDKN